ncbi:MAG: thiamine phosphate synthase [Bryobacterales bacterium]
MNLARVLLYYITDRQSCPVPLEARVREAFDAGVDMVQLREKDLEARDLCNLASSLAAPPRRGKLLINARADVAFAAGADGVHIPSSGPAPRVVRSICERSLSIGVSCHSPDEVARAEQEGADFVVFGPVFDTPSKRRYRPPKASNGLPRFAVGLGYLSSHWAASHSPMQGNVSSKARLDSPPSPSFSARDHWRRWWPNCAPWMPCDDAPAPDLGCATERVYSQQAAKPSEASLTPRCKRCPVKTRPARAQACR